MGGCSIERYYVDALAYAEDVTGVHGVPVGGLVTEVRLGGKEKLESYV